MKVSAAQGCMPGPLWALFALALWLLGAPGVGAQAGAGPIRPAGTPIVTKRLQRVAEMIPGSDTDLPPYLAKPSDIYLLVTVGASYTEIVALANPETSPPALARALSSGLAGTPLAGRTVEWSPDRYAAAAVSVHRAHFGAMRAVNTVSVAPLLAGLRRAGLSPHLLLRVPAHAQAGSLPRSRYGTRAFRWYDAARLGSRPSLTVSAQMTWRSPVRVLAYCLAGPGVCLLGLWLAGAVSGRGQKETAVRRGLFRRISTAAMFAALAAQVGGLVYLLRTPTLAALADLWLGSATTTVLVPFLVAGALPVSLFVLLIRKQELRRFGPLESGSVIPMSDEEKAVRKRVAQYSMVPHLVGAVALGALPAFVSRTSPLYPYVHPLTTILPMACGLLVVALFQKQLNRFTTKTKDDDLTWRARQLGQTLGARMPDVFVEDSSRAAHLAFAVRQGHHITLSRKLTQTFTPAEIDFVLTCHLAGMARKANFGAAGLILVLLFLPVAVFPAYFLWARATLGASGTLSAVHSPWFFPASMAYLLTSVVLLPLVNKISNRQQAGNDAAADRAALEATGNGPAAESALSKLDLSPELALMRSGGSLSAEMAVKAEKVQAVRRSARQAALKESVQALGLASSPPNASDLSPFSASETDQR